MLDRQTKTRFLAEKLATLMKAKRKITSQNVCKISVTHLLLLKEITYIYITKYTDIALPIDIINDIMLGTESIKMEV